jgi:DNA repair protein RAD50
MKDKRGRNLDDCLINIRDCEEELTAANARLEACRTKIKGVEKEISDAGASNANLRENIRIRKLRKSIEEWEKKIAGSDVVGAADAKLKFEKQWPKMKDHEARLNTEVSGGGFQALWRG